jgi:hypothetical protein
MQETRRVKLSRLLELVVGAVFLSLLGCQAMHGSQQLEPLRYRMYYVYEADTWETLSIMWGVPVGTLKNENPVFSRSGELRTGDRIRIPIQ